MKDLGSLKYLLFSVKFENFSISKKICIGSIKRNKNIRMSTCQYTNRRRY